MEVEEEEAEEVWEEAEEEKRHVPQLRLDEKKQKPTSF